MNYNFTDRARKILANAREEAIRLGHAYIGTEHVLLGLIRERQGTAFAVLTALSADLDVLRENVKQAVAGGGSRIALGELPYTSRAKKVLEFALSEARELNHSHTGPEHILLGLLREEKGIAAEVLHSVGVTLDNARRQTLKQLASSPHAAESITDPEQGYDEVVVVRLTNGEVHRVRETRGPSAREFAEAIARRGAWITGEETFFVPVTAIARIQIYSPGEWAKLGLEEVP